MTTHLEVQLSPTVSANVEVTYDETSPDRTVGYLGERYVVEVYVYELHTSDDVISREWLEKRGHASAVDGLAEWMIVDGGLLYDPS